VYRTFVSLRYSILIEIDC